MVDPICGTRFRYINFEGEWAVGWWDVLAVLMSVDSGRQGEFHLMIISTVSMMMIHLPSTATAPPLSMVTEQESPPST